jgi:cell division protein FtsL
MLEKVWEKIDKFYLTFVVVMVLMAALLVVAFRGVFSAYLHAYEVNKEDLEVDAKIQKESLDEAYTWVTNKESLSLQVRD